MTNWDWPARYRRSDCELNSPFGGCAGIPGGDSLCEPHGCGGPPCLITRTLEPSDLPS